MSRKILHVCPYLHPRAGGPVVVAIQYARRQKQLGHEPSILTTDWYSPGGKEEVESRYGSEHKLNVLQTGASFWKVFSPANRKQIREAVRDADLVHVHGLWHAPGLLAARCARVLSKPYVVSPHGMLDPYSMGVGALKKRLYWRLLEKRNLQAADRVVFTTEDEKNLASESVGKIGRGEVVLLGADDPPAESREILKQEMHDRYPVLKGKKVALFLGRLHEKKGLHTLVGVFAEVLKEVPDAFLLVVGEGEEGYKDIVRSEIRRLGLEKSVLLTGLLEGREKWSAVAASDVFVLPSLQENFALVVAEVMKMGLPVIISDKVNLASYVRSANAGIVLELRALDQWPQAVAGLLRNQEQLQALGAKGMTLANYLFSWDKSTEKLMIIYEDVLETAGS